MKAFIWFTGHEIADAVARAVMDGLMPYNALWGVGKADQAAQAEDRVFESADVHVGYGILRGMDQVFKRAKRAGIPWVNIDRGYFRAHHYEGYYRLSLNGTQQTIGVQSMAPNYSRLRRLSINLEPWRGFDPSKPILYCPATQAVANFFDHRGFKIDQKSLDRSGLVTRIKGDAAPLDFRDYNYVHTVNSSVGWQAIQAGIPCVSDPICSIVGARYKEIPLAELGEAQYLDREKLFGCMANLQLTLSEIRAGKVWETLAHLLSLSAMTAENPPPLTLPPTPSLEEPRPTPASTT